MPVPINLQTAASTDPALIPLINGTQTFVSAVAPNDGHVHMVIVDAIKLVATTETGGAVVVAISTVANTIPLFPGAAAGAAQQYAAGAVFAVPSGATISVNQSTALTGGGSSVEASIVIQQ